MSRFAAEAADAVFDLAGPIL